MDDVDLIPPESLMGMVPRRKHPYPKCDHCNMYCTPGTTGKCPFCAQGTVR